MIGERLIRLRGVRTQQEVADALGISRARYSHYENGRNEPDLLTLGHLADYFNVSTDYLVGRNEAIRENRVNYSIRFSEDLQKMQEMFAEDLESYLFWKEYKQMPVKKRHDLLRMWNVVVEMDKKKK